MADGRRDRSRLPPRADQRHRRARRTTARRWSTPTARGAVCVANTFRCKIPHKKAFFAVLTDERFRQLFTPDERRPDRRARPVDAPGRRRRTTELDGRPIDLLAAPARAPRRVRHQAERRVRRHGRHARLGDRRAGVGRRADRARGRASWRLGGAGADRGAPRGVPDVRRRRSAVVDARHAGRLRARTSSAAARRLPHAPERTGLANVTSGGGQVPAFVVTPREVVIDAVRLPAPPADSARDICLTDCPATDARGGCHYARVERDGDLPPADPAIVDVAVLDMHHGWPNLGHDAIVHAVQNAVCDLQPALQDAGLRVRVISYDVRRGHAGARAARRPARASTSAPAGRAISIRAGTTASSPGSQGIGEDPAGSRRSSRCSTRIRADRDAALLAVCHTFGVMCRWLGVADAVLRGPRRAARAPASSRTCSRPTRRTIPGSAASRASCRRRRLPDPRQPPLRPHPDRRPLAAGVAALGHETRGVGGPRGDALTMIEVARDRDRRTMPRILGVNHHPEIVNRAAPAHDPAEADGARRGDAGWYAERAAALTADIDDHGRPARCT